MAPVLPGPMSVACPVSKKFAEESTGGCHAEGFSALHPYTPHNSPELSPFPSLVLYSGYWITSSKGFIAVIFKHGKDFTLLMKGKLFLCSV